jgi:hypothetical protein
LSQSTSLTNTDDVRRNPLQKLFIRFVLHSSGF